MGERGARSDNMMALCDECIFEDCDFAIDTDSLLDPNRDFIGNECQMARLKSLLDIIPNVEADTVEEFVDKLVEIYKGEH